MSERIRLTVEMDVTVPQALALQAMFEYWNQLAGLGGSRMVSFYVDGDGNFHPKCKVTTDQEIPELTDEMRERAIVGDDNGDRSYDFDPIAWMLHNDEDEHVKLLKRQLRVPPEHKGHIYTPGEAVEAAEKRREQDKEKW